MAAEVFGTLAVIYGFNALLAVWVYRNARWHGSDLAAGWALLVVCTGVVGLAVYLFVRGDV
ncbi:hypothetical protein NGM10_11010 [Halorussus salilacus]|uniref:hypothetical protein n=1 Tax=Halorussus salilacus TaxID=2953750 RepID=UPI00209DA616|nr:hypothetical protein [Halorussus salilacus]USZ67259.1 hypothetical protein NGM10_11010 [Halorussus salilacus]